MKNLPDLSRLKYSLDLPDGFSCLDVGANHGQFYVAFKNLFPNSRCLMIEANPHCERRLRGLQSEYRIIGLSDHKGELELVSTVLKPYSKGASFYIEAAIRDLPENEILRTVVPVDTMDNLFKEDTFDFIKIDVQGSELDILNGGEITIKKSKYVSLEISLVEYNIGAPGYKKILNKMLEFGFFIKDVIEEHNTSSGNLIQLDLLFTNTIKDHVYDCLTPYKNYLDYENWNRNYI